MKFKRKLNEIEVRVAKQMLDAKMSFGQIARHFRTNKPSILKALGLWNKQ